MYFLIHKGTPHSGHSIIPAMYSDLHLDVNNHLVTV